MNHILSRTPQSSISLAMDASLCNTFIHVQCIYTMHLYMCNVERVDVPLHVYVCTHDAACCLKTDLCR